MKRMNTGLLVLAALMASGACSNQGGVVGLDSRSPEIEVDLLQAEVSLDSTAYDRESPLDVDVTPQEVFFECEPGDGCFGEPCLDGGDCASGFCVDHLGNKVCSSQCVEECPDGFSCREVGAGGPDIIWVCISDFRVLCRPCTNDLDCASAGGEDLCVNYGSSGRFCGGACGGDKVCPAGYQCQEVSDDGGATTWQCLLSEGECPCSDQSIFLGAATVCESANTFGVCPGQRFCTEDGLSVCNGLDAVLESCNGIDDDCDGVTDEETCDDGNACTMDSCSGEAGCTHEPLTGTNCDDGNACTLTDHCDSGTCQGTLIACDDSNPCTDDTCDGAAGCLFTANTLACDDNDPCTIGDQCHDALCSGVPVSCQCESDSDCKQYEDGNLCNGTLYCDQSGVEFQCKVDSDTVISCDALVDPCVKAVCNPTNGACQALPANDGYACNDGDACTYSEVCANGNCVGGQALNCNDGNDCTDDSCDALVGCKHQPIGGECNDGNACTWPDVCADGNCVAGDPVDCDDQNVCTVDSCNSGKGCVHTPSGGACEDNNACTVGDHCQGGLCVPSKALDCDDANICTNDSCEPATGCHHEFNTAPCSDGDICTTKDACQQGECVGGKSMSCDDGNECTSDSCNALVGCVYTANAGPCDDLDPCTEEDSCSGGVCVGTVPKDCDDGNVCTDDLCTPMAGCTHKNNQHPCSDGNLCTSADVCAKGLCVPGPEVSCDDGNPCTDDACVPEQGCLHSANSAPCDDENLCTLNDSCVGGKCKATATLDCNDGNICTSDSCDPDDGCQYAFNTLPCTDGDACTLGDVCHDGGCVGSKEKMCNDFNPCTDDLCDPVEGCLFIANVALCSDGNACTEGDVCADGWCHPGQVLDCDDSNPCTDDLCDLVQGCLHVVNADPCDDGEVCTVNDTCALGLCQPGLPRDCDDDNLCTDDACDSGVGCVHSNNSQPCDDGSICTDGDVCANGACVPGVGIDCDDANSCTEDSCHDELGCQHETLADGVVCADDGNSCTSDTCQAGVCEHSGDGWSGYGDHCYQYFTVTKNWADARADCQARGGDLASIGDAGENSFVHGLIQPTEDAPWIGFNDQASEGSWKWSDGSPVTFTNWATSEPNNSGNEDCAHIYSYNTSPQNKRWNDANCSSSYKYICEKP